MPKQCQNWIFFPSFPHIFVVMTTMFRTSVSFSLRIDWITRFLLRYYAHPHHMLAYCFLIANNMAVMFERLN